MQHAACKNIKTCCTILNMDCHSFVNSDIEYFQIKVRENNNRIGGLQTNNNFLFGA